MSAVRRRSPASATGREPPGPDTARASYPTDPQWAVVAPLIPARRVHGRRRTTDLRQVVAAIHYHWRTDCPWRKLPPGFPPWPTVYGYFRDWHDDGTLRKIRAVLAPPARQIPPPPPKLDPDRAG